MQIDFNRDQEVLVLALGKWGFEMQKVIAIEEMCELIHALIRSVRNDSINADGVLEEIADVQIMIWQLAEMYGRDKVQPLIEIKMQRLAERIKT